MHLCFIKKKLCSFLIKDIILFEVFRKHCTANAEEVLCAISFSYLDNIEFDK